MWYGTNATLHACGFQNSGSLWWSANILVSYLIWIAQLICFIDDINDLLSLSTSHLDLIKMVHSKPTVKMKRKRRLRKKRIRLWFGRRKRRIAKQKPSFTHLNQRQSFWGYDRPPDSPWSSKMLQLYSNFCGAMWDELSTSNPLLIDLMIGTDPFFGRKQHPLQRLEELIMNVDGHFVDLNKITQVDDCLRWQTSYFQNNGRNVIFDSGASISISPKKEDFIELDESHATINSLRLNAVSGRVPVKGVGTLKILVYTDSGHARYLKTKAFYVPSSHVTLFSVCRYCNETKDGAKFVVNDEGCSFHFTTSSGGGKTTFNLDKHNFLPTTSTFQQLTRQTANSTSFNVVNKQNINLTSSQKHLLSLHFCLGHWNLPWIQSLIRKGVLKCSDPHVTKPTAICQCAACNIAKGQRRPKESLKHEQRESKEGNLTKGILDVGSRVSSDQFICSTPGRLPHTYGKENEVSKYVGGTIFIDEASGFTYLENQVSVNAIETIRAKNRFEREASRHGIKIKSYRADNGIYRSEEFKNALNAKGQTIIYSGVGAHHHNGIAERAIRTMSNSARAMMIHAILHNPTAITADLWPFAIKYAVFLWNKMPRMDSGLSPEEIFYQTRSDHEQLRQAKVWGCPAYVLDPKLQDGKSLPRWSPRSKLGQFLGRSDSHAGSIGLIRNLQTGAVSPQFHVVYDNHFTTVNCDTNVEDAPVPDNFHDLMRFSRENNVHPEDLRPKDNRNVDSDIDNRNINIGGRNEIPSSEGAPPANPHVDTSVPNSAIDDTANTPSFDLNDDGGSVSGNGTPNDTPNETPITESLEQPAETVERRYPLRIRKQPDWYHKSYVAALYFEDPSEYYDILLIQSNLCKMSDSMTRQFDVFDTYKVDDFDNDLLDGIHPFAFAARANSEDTLSYREAMSSPDAEGFREMMKKEIEGLEEFNAWDVVPRSEAAKAGKQVLGSTWAFRRKRYPDGSLKKLKARFCIRGYMQQAGVDFFDTFSPVVSWSTVRLLLIISVILELETKQVDYTLAFPQAPLLEPTFIEMPVEFEQEGMVLSLKRNLYGGRDSPVNFFYYLQEQLNLRGFKASQNDPGLFMNKETGVIILVYVDDCIFFHKNGKVIDKCIDSLKKGNPKDKRFKQLQLDVEDDYAGFLGIDIHKNKDGSIELLQTGLIDRIIKAVNLSHDDVTIRLEPAAKEPLSKDENGPPRREDWSYPSLVGMLLYLSSNSRPDIAFAVNQAARFNHCPRLCHETAIKRIARYLKGTSTRGLIIHPKKDDLNLELYADADFAGLWNVENSDDPICVRSRTGFVITLGGVPVTWNSKLQTEIATSTMHAEYIALSTSMRELIPIQNLMNDVCDVLQIERDEATKIALVHEDNEPALKLANSPRAKITPHSKHFAVKYHWFREKLMELKVQICHVKTDMQKADIFTKGLMKTNFKIKRMLLMGW